MAKDKCPEEEGGGGGWLMSYADLMTLLFAAFVVVYGITRQGKGEVVRIVGAVSSIRESFIEVPDDIPLEQKKGPILKGKAIFKYFKGDDMKPPVIKRYKRSINVLNVINADIVQVKQMIKLISGRKERGKLQPVTANQVEDGIRLRLLGSYFYDRGSYRVKRKELDKLRKIGELLKSLGKKASVEGHSDSKPPPGQFGKWELSSLRASHVVKFFINEVGIPRESLKASG